MSTQSLAFLVISLHVIFSHTCGVATISLLKLVCIVVLMDLRIGVKSLSRIPRMTVRRASPSVSYPGSRKHRTEASIRVPRKFNHTHGNNMINR
jgi:hypothetical protein